MKNIILIGFIILALFSCKKEDQNTDSTPTDTSTDKIYYYDRKENEDLQIYSYDGIVEKNLSNDNTHDYWWVKVNPSKTKFLCYRSPKGAGSNSFSSCELMLFDIDGSNGTVIVPLNQYGWEIQAHAKWSPDGAKILGIAKCKDPDINDMVSRGRIVIFDTDGSNPVIVSKFTHEVADPAWSHDGNNVVYVGPSDLNDPTNPEKAEIYQATLNYNTMELENPIRLTFDDKYCYDPAWSPDGEWIAYSKGAFINLFWTENHDIYKCRPDGSEDVLVLHDGKVNGVPTWTTNGSKLVFHVLGLNTPPPFSIYTCDANGQNKKKVLGDFGIERATVSAVNK